MANTNRRRNYIDRNGRMFMPISVEGGNYKDSFFTSTKIVTMMLIAAGLFLALYMASSGSDTIQSYIVWLFLWFIASFYATRFIIFEEKFYYRMHKEFNKNELTTPALFWTIASIKDTENGAIMTFVDAKVGVIVRVDRDTITGKDDSFEERHYDAISDFLGDLVSKKYSFCYMDIMEHAGKDPRLSELSKLVYKSDNPNICKLMELEVGHIKNISNVSLYESDFFLIYSNELSKIDTIIGDVTESILKLLGGAYANYTILDKAGLIDLDKDYFGVTYFNATQASLMMYSNNSNSTFTPFKVNGLVWKATSEDDEPEEQILSNAENNKLNRITSGVIEETIKRNEVSLKKSLYRKENKKITNIDFESLSSIPSKKHVLNSVKHDENSLNKNETTRDTKTNNKASNKNSKKIEQELMDDDYIDL